MNLPEHQEDVRLASCQSSECAYRIVKKGDEILLRSLFSYIFHPPGWLRVVLPFQYSGRGKKFFESGL